MLMRTLGSWTQCKELGTPPQSSYTAGRDIIVTSLHWTSAPRRPSILIVTYMSHGIVYVAVRSGHGERDFDTLYNRTVARTMRGRENVSERPLFRVTCERPLTFLKITTLTAEP